MRKMTESGLADTVQPNNNIICVQCLFRKLLTSRMLDIQTQILSKRLRQDLDFEVYYQVDGQTAKELLSSRVFATNVKKLGQAVPDRPIIDILAKFEPFAAFLTDAQGDRITDEILSDKSQNILRRRNAQSSGFSIYRFGFFNAVYSSVFANMFASAADGTVYDPSEWIQMWKKDTIRGLVKDGPDGERIEIGANELIQIKPFVLGGYWNRIEFDPAQNEFKVSKKDQIGTIIPSLDKSILKYSGGLIRSVDDVDDSSFISFLETAAGKALQGDSAGSADLRTTRLADRKAPERAPKNKFVTRWMKEDGGLRYEAGVIVAPEWMQRLF